MIRSIVFSSLFHILVILIMIFNMAGSNQQKPKEIKEIKVNIIEQEIKKAQTEKKIQNKSRVKAEPKIKPKSKPKSIPEKTKQAPKIKKEIPEKTIINKTPKKKNPVKKRLPKVTKKLKKEVKKTSKKKEIPKKIIRDIVEYTGVDDFGISGRERANLKLQVTRCYQKSKEGFKKFNINVSVNVRVMSNGVIDYNNMIFTNQIELSKVDKKILHKITMSIVDTLKDCSPLRNLPKDKYGIWKRMNIKFKY
ncbi:MAG: hypothetical protein ACI9IL_000206 [Rickettsiales bacterium]|jgi:hypothetical protein